MSAATSLPSLSIERIAESRFGVRTFRPGQRPLIDAVLEGRDALGILPTGGGKSLCYQLPALVLPKITVVVSPLLALMKDQRDHLARVHVDAAELDSSLTAREARACEIEIRNGEHPIVYVTPERLRTDACIAMLAARGVSLVAIDEAHCVSQWGHDFRPAYLCVADAVRRLGRPPVLALTATATKAVEQDITQQLGLEKPHVVRNSVSRDNLALRVFQTEEDEDKRDRLRAICGEETDAGIIYCATVENADALFDWLSHVLPKVGRYHAQRPLAERMETQASFMRGEVRVIIATKAFGLGVDKPDVRFVVHAQMPDSIESYWQEAGRAGRDGAEARAVLLFRRADARVQHWFLRHKYPREKEVLWVVDAIAAAKEPITMEAIAERTALPVRRVDAVAVHLQQTGMARFDGGRLRAVAEMGADVAVELARSFGVRLEGDRARLKRMIAYGEGRGCRARMLLEYFGEERGTCEKCDVCAEAYERIKKASTSLEHCDVTQIKSGGRPDSAEDEL